MHLKLHSDMKKMPTISYVSIRRQGRVLFWLKLLLLSCERLCKPSHSQHSSANTLFIPGFPQPDKQLFCAQSHWTPAPWNSSENHHPKRMNWQHCCQQGPQNPLVPRTQEWWTQGAAPITDTEVVPESSPELLQSVVKMSPCTVLVL